MPQLAAILVGDHLGQVKKILWPSAEISLLPNLIDPNSSNPVASIQPLIGQGKHLIAYKNGQLFLYDSIRGETKECDISGEDSLIKALLTSDNNVVMLYEKRIVMSDIPETFKIKRGVIRDGQTHDNQVAIVGKDIPLNVIDLNTCKRVFEGDRPGKNFLGIEQDCEALAMDFVGGHRVATCSKSDSVIRIFDIRAKTKPIISVDLNQTAFNEYAEAGRFMSVASTGDDGHSIVVGSNVGQMIAIDLRFSAKIIPKKRLQPKSSKVLGGFKGARGATVKDIKIVTAPETDVSYKVISCCLDRYMRIHNFSKSNRYLDKHVYLKTRPICCSPVFYQD